MRRGFFILEAIAGMVLLSLIAGSMVLLLTGYSQVHTRIRDQRRAVQTAEAALIAMQNHQAVSREDLAVERIGQASDQLRWVCVTARQGQQKAQLYGLVPAEAVASEAKP